MTERAEHWEEVYRRKAVTSVSWYRPHLELSLKLIDRVARSKRAAILDIGGGASTLVDDLLLGGYDDVTVLDIAESALEAARVRLGDEARRVRWIAADFLEAKLDEQRYDVCHDRAVFHFLGTGEEKARYFEQVERILRPEGALVLATFAKEGPERCSGLQVSRYDEEALREVMGSGLRVVESERESHHTPSGQVQEMMYFVVRRNGSTSLS